MIVLDAARDPEAGRRAEIAALEDDALRKRDAGIRFGAGDRIPNRAAFHLDVLTALDARLDAIEGEIVRGGVGAMHLRPRPAEDRPRPPDLASEKHFNRRALRSLCALIQSANTTAMQKQVEEVSKRVIQLKAVSVFELKLDRSLVTECATEPQRAALCKIVIDLIHHIGSTAVAIGLEKAADVNALRDPNVANPILYVANNMDVTREFVAEYNRTHPATAAAAPAATPGRPE